jgi:GT2 family glycosyltransferase
MLYPDGHLQHAGVIVGLGGAAGHVLRFSAADQPDRFGPPGLGRSRLVQHFSVVTAACLVVRKSLYQQVGGLDEDAFPVTYNDVDFCLKLQDCGYRNLYTPFATLYHHESASRGSDDDDPAKAARAAQELANLRQRWFTWDYHDPAYNPNFSLYGEDCSYSYPPRV